MPLSSYWYKMDAIVGGPVRSVWLAVILAFILGKYSLLEFCTEYTGIKWVEILGNE